MSGACDDGRLWKVIKVYAGRCNKLVAGCFFSLFPFLLSPSLPLPLVFSLPLGVSE